MLDEEGRRQKAAKIVAVVRHALGVRVARRGCARSTSAARRGSSPTSWRWPGRPPAGSTSTSRGSRRPGRASASGSTSGWPAARTCPSTTTRSTSRCSTTSTSTSSTPRPSSPTSTGCCGPGGLLYLGIGHRWQVVEPHHRLPFLSWLPRGAADRYMRRHRQGRPLLRALLHAGRAAAAVRGLRRLGLHPAGAHRPGGLRRRRQRAGLGGEGARRRRSARPCRWCPPTCGRRSRGRPRPPGRRCASRRATWR